MEKIKSSVYPLYYTTPTNKYSIYKIAISNNNNFTYKLNIYETCR